MKLRKVFKETLKQREQSDDGDNQERTIQRNVKRMKKAIEVNKTKRKAALEVLKKVVLRRDSKAKEDRDDEIWL